MDLGAERAVPMDDGADHAAIHVGLHATLRTPTAGAEPARATTASPAAASAGERGWPTDPLSRRWPNAGADPASALVHTSGVDFLDRTGKWPHPRYLSIAKAFPSGASAEDLLAAEGEWLRRCRERGLKP